jgi:MFS family permease
MTFFVAASMFAVTIYIPFYLQLVDGVSPSRSGVLLLPLMAGMLVTSIVSGRLVTLLGRYKAFPMAGGALMTIGMSLMTLLGAHTSLVVEIAYLVVFGVGMGMTLQIVVVAIQNAVARDDLGTATSTVSFFRNLGAASGTALLGSVLWSRVGFWLPRLVPRRAHLDLTPSFTITPRALRALPPSVRAGVTDAFVHSLHVMFIVAIPLAALALLFAVALKEIPLREHAGAAVGHGLAPAPRLGTAPMETVAPSAGPAHAEVDGDGHDGRRPVTVTGPAGPDATIRPA